jgi:hypothetical protein
MFAPKNPWPQSVPNLTGIVAVIFRTSTCLKGSSACARHDTHQSNPGELVHTDGSGRYRLCRARLRENALSTGSMATSRKPINARDLAIGSNACGV